MADKPQANYVARSSAIAVIADRTACSTTINWNNTAWYLF